MFQALRIKRKVKRLLSPRSSEATVLAAINALTDLGDEGAIEPLTGALVDWRGNVRRAAAEALDRLGQPQWINLIKGDLADFARVGQEGGAVAVGPLLRATKEEPRDYKDPLWGEKNDAYQAAKKAIMMVRGGGVFEALVRGTEQGSEIAVEALGKLGDERAFDVLIHLYREDSPRGWAAAYALGDLQDPRAFYPLVSSLLQEDSAAVAGALGRLKDPRACDPLLKVLEKGGRSKSNAVWALGELRDNRAVEALLRELKPVQSPFGPRYHDGAGAAKALGKIGDTRAVVPIIDLLGQMPLNQLDCLDAIDALGELHDQRGLDILVSILTLFGERATKAIDRAVSTLVLEAEYNPVLIGTKVDPARMTHILGQNVGRARCHAATALGQLGIPQSVPYLQAAQEDDDGAVAEAASEALKTVNETLRQAKGESSSACSTDGSTAADYTLERDPAFTDFRRNAFRKPATIPIRTSHIARLIDGLSNALQRRCPGLSPSDCITRVTSRIRLTCPHCGPYPNEFASYLYLAAKGAFEPGSVSTTVVFMGKNVAALGHGRCPGCGGDIIRLTFDPRGIHL